MFGVGARNACQVLIGVGAHSTCQALALVSAQGAHQVQCLSGTGSMWQSMRCSSGSGNQGGVAPVNFQTSHLHRSYGTWQDMLE